MCQANRMKTGNIPYLMRPQSDFHDRARDHLPGAGCTSYGVYNAEPTRRPVPLIYKICPEQLWCDAELAGSFNGAAIDLADGYIHFSTGGQLRETAAKHFAGQSGLVLIAVDDTILGSALRYEPSRGGALFPHLYSALDPKTVRWIAPLTTGTNGSYVIPEDIS